MSSYQKTQPARGYYPGSHPFNDEFVWCSDPFKLAREQLTRNYKFQSGLYSNALQLNVNTDKAHHRPDDIVDHMERKRPLPGLELV